jgi:hypothetical protein
MRERGEMVWSFVLYHLVMRVVMPMTGVGSSCGELV